MTDRRKEDEDVSGLAEAVEPEARILKGIEGGQVAVENKAAEAKKTEPQLPKLDATEFKVYDSIAEHMPLYHNHFRQCWTTLHSACVNNKRPVSISLKKFISADIQFCSLLTAHHGYEEANFFPLLATKMPGFKAGRNAAELLRQHKEIHKRLGILDGYLQKCRGGEIELELRFLKEKMDDWGEVLWKHLDQEVVTLGAENMRKYWTAEEMWELRRVIGV